MVAACLPRLQEKALHLEELRQVRPALLECLHFTTGRLPAFQGEWEHNRNITATGSAFSDGRFRPNLPPGTNHAKHMHTVVRPTYYSVVII